MSIEGSVFLREVFDEVARARAKHPAVNSLHEGYAVIAEELDEFWDEVRSQDDSERLIRAYRELVQTAAMCQRTAEDVISRSAAPSDEPGAVDVERLREAHHIDRVTHSGGRRDGHVTYDCDCGWHSPYADLDEAEASRAALSHLNVALANSAPTGAADGIDADVLALALESELFLHLGDDPMPTTAEVAEHIVAEYMQQGEGKEKRRVF